MTELKPSWIVYNSLGRPNVKETEKVDGYCMVCGTHIKEGVPQKKSFSGNFTNWDKLQRLDQTHVCRACYFCFKQNWLRNYSFIAGERRLALYIAKNIPSTIDDQYTIVFRRRNGLLDDLFNIRSLKNNIFYDNFIFCINNSRKHMIFRATINTNPETFIIQYGDTELLLNTKTFKKVYVSLQELYNSGFSKRELKTGGYKSHKIMRYGPKKIGEHEMILEEKRGSVVFNLMIDLLYKEKNG